MLTRPRRPAPARDPLPRLRTGSVGWLLTVEALSQRFLYEAEDPDTPALRRAFLAVDGPQLAVRRRRAWLSLQNAPAGWQIPAQPPRPR